MRKLSRGAGQASVVTGAFANTSSVESRVVLQSASSVNSSPLRSFKDDQTRFRRAGIRASASSSGSSSSSPSVGRHGEHLATLGLSAAASKHEIKQAYRKLALQYHPDVCKGEHCALMFKQVNNAYEVALEVEDQGRSDAVSEEGGDCDLEGFMGATDDGWDDWEEWMGWEGAGITDYSSHINPSYSF